MKSGKRLYLLRHAKSDWDDPGLQDFDRPLSKRGRKAAKRMGREVRRLGLAPELVLCSSAARTRETWDLMSAALAAAPAVEFLPSLYLAAAKDILAAIKACDDGIGRLMVIGHNPGLEVLAGQLAGEGSDDQALACMREKYPTGALAEIVCDDAGWTGFGSATARLQRFLRPRDLG